MRMKTNALPLALLVLAAVACGSTGDAKPAPGSDEQLMQQGLDQLYKTNDPIASQETFRTILKKTPSHYGAHYQIAVALDRGGKPTEARAAWEDMRQLAEAIKDTASLRLIRLRLAAPDTASQDAMMALGLYLFYKAGDMQGAAAQYRLVLAKNPSHYGATYQLAKTLDAMGQKGAATPLWQRTLGMATQYQDTATITQARNRLK